MNRDPYQVLGLDRSASTAEIKRAYRRLARENHPDTRPGDEHAAAQFRDICDAYTQLSGANRNVPPPQPESGWDALRNNGHARNTTEVTVMITLAQAFTGVTLDATTTNDSSCPECHGSGLAPGTSTRQCHVCRGAGAHRVGTLSVNCATCGGLGAVAESRCEHCTDGYSSQVATRRVAVPAGVVDGQHLVAGGAGDTGGDLVVNVRVEKSPLFERGTDNPADVYMDVPVTYVEACLGAEVRVPTLEKPIVLTLPPGTPPGSVLRVRGRGMPRVGSSERGDLYVRTLVHVPDDLTAAERRLIARLGGHDRPVRQHLLDES